MVNDMDGSMSNRCALNLSNMLHSLPPPYQANDAISDAGIVTVASTKRTDLFDLPSDLACCWCNLGIGRSSSLYAVVRGTASLMVRDTKHALLNSI